MNIFVRFIFLVFPLAGIGNAWAQIPVANFTANKTSGCNPHCVSFTSTSTGNPTSYFWNFGNSTTSNLQNPSVCYTAPGTYTVTLTVSNANGTDVETKTNYITVHTGPVVNFTASPSAGCPPHTVVFTNNTTSANPGAITYEWFFGDGSPIVTTQHTMHTFQNPGSYPVTLKATDAQGCVTISPPYYINVHTPPAINFTAQGKQCDVPALINFSANITGNPPYSYQWDFGDGGTANTANPTHTYNAAGTYHVRLIVTDANGCKDTLIKTGFMNIGHLTPNFTVNNGCVGTSLQFINTTNVSDSVKWYFGDGGTDTAQNPSHVYAIAGTFTVKLVVYRSTCQDSITKQVQVFPGPNVNFSYNPLQPCPPPTVVNFINNSTNASTYTWNFYDGSTSNLTSPSHTFTTDSFFAVKLIAISSQGCIDSLIDTVKIYNLYPALHEYPLKGCIPLTIQFDPVFETRDPVTKSVLPPPPYPYPIVSYFWDLGNGSTSTVQKPFATYNTVGFHKVKLTFTTANGCTITDSIDVSSGHKPTALFTISHDSICVNAPDTFTSYSTGPSPLIFEWDFGDGRSLPSVSNPVVHHYSQSGIYSVTLIASHYGCNDTLTMHDTVVVLPPTSFFDVVYSCDTPLKMRFTNTSSVGVTSRLWLFGDGTSDTAAQPTHIYPALGSYMPLLITYNSQYGCVDTAGTPIKLVDPVLSFTTPDTAICTRDSINFTPSLLGYNGLYPQQYIWWIDTTLPPLIGDTTLGIWGNRFDTNGVFTVNMRTSHILSVSPRMQICWDTVSKQILVARPHAGFTASPTLGCSPLSVVFTDTSTNTSGAFQTTRAWDFGNGTNTTTSANISNTYTAAGRYDIRLIVTDNVGCNDTLVKTKYIDVRDPVAAFTVSDSNVCVGELLAFQNGTSGTTKFTSQWHFGDGATDTAKNPVHKYSQTGLYTVKLIITDSLGCVDSVVKAAYINVSKPDANFSLSDTLSICPPLNVIMTNLSTGAATYLWNFGNNTTSSLQNPTASYITPGVYTIRLIAVSGQGCRDTAYAQVRLLGYSGALTYAPLTGCAPLKVNFQAQLYNIPSVIWDFSDGVTQPANGIDTISHVYTTPGAYVPKLILSDNSGCQTSSIGLDTIKVDGIHAGFITSPPCVNTLMNFIDTSFSYFSSITKWNWNINNGQYLNNTSSPAYAFNTGTYPVKLIVTNENGCKDSIESDFTIFDLPTIVASADTSICSGDRAQLFANGGVSYIWTPAATLSCNNCSNPVATPSVATSYVVMGTDARGCTNKDTVKVNIQFKTTSEAGKGGEICLDSSFQLQAWGAQAYEWRPAEFLNNYQLSNPVASPKVTTTYTVITTEGSCIPDTHTVRVVVHPKPIVDAGSDATIVAGGSVILNARGSNIEFFQWSPVQSLSCENCSNPEARPNVTTKYKVIVTSLHGCKSFDTVTVYVLCDQSQLFIPNSFSPNGDGANEVFYPRGVGLQRIVSFRIYNRWGELIFERRGIQLNDAANGWDGTYKGRELPPDVFVYVIDGTCESGTPISWKGDVTLLR